MTHHSLPLDYAILEEVNGKKFADALRKLEITEVLNLDEFLETERFYPSIGSLFLFGGGGSYDLEDPDLGELYVANGTLASLPGFDLERASKNYYEGVFNKRYIKGYKFESFSEALRKSGKVIVDDVEHTVLNFDEADRRIKAGEFVNSALNPTLQRYAGRKPTLAVITLIDPVGNRFLVRARYDPATGRIFSPSNEI